MPVLQGLEVFHNKNLWFPAQGRMPIHTSLFMEKVFLGGFLEQPASVTPRLLALFQQTSTILSAHVSRCIKEI